MAISKGSSGTGYEEVCQFLDGIISSSHPSQRNIPTGRSGQSSRPSICLLLGNLSRWCSSFCSSRELFARSVGPTSHPTLHRTSLGVTVFGSKPRQELPGLLDTASFSLKLRSSSPWVKNMELKQKASCRATQLANQLRVGVGRGGSVSIIISHNSHIQPCFQPDKSTVESRSPYYSAS
jgi:hypothetical protein